ncbi:hypothetical protein GCM10027422_06690 [Hymenobacter arcticus]
MAQYAPGVYKLVNNPQQYVGNLLVDGPELRVKNGKRITHVAASAITYVKIADKQYFIPAQGFLVPAGVKYVPLPSTLVEVLDSGRVSLLRYESANARAYGVNGEVTSGGAVAVYLVKTADATNAISLPDYAWTNKGQKLRLALRPYAADRPDLLALLDGGPISEGMLTAFFHALNSGQPFVKP